MNAKNTTQPFVIALAMIITPATRASVVFGQDKAHEPSAESPNHEQGQDNDLVGVWEAVTLGEVDCQTALPLPGSPTIRVMYTFNQGGTMSEENTDPIEGPYRSSSAGIWKRISARNYTAAYQHYSFDPDRTFKVLVKIRTNIRLSRFLDSFTERGTFEVINPGGTVIYAGCFADTARRLTF